MDLRSGDFGEKEKMFSRSMGDYLFISAEK
jgi:hypothetical protein